MGLTQMQKELSMYLMEVCLSLSQMPIYGMGQLTLQKSSVKLEIDKL